MPIKICCLLLRNQCELTLFSPPTIGLHSALVTFWFMVNLLQPQQKCGCFQVTSVQVHKGFKRQMNCYILHQQKNASCFLIAIVINCSWVNYKVYQGITCRIYFLTLYTFLFMSNWEFLKLRLVRQCSGSYDDFFCRLLILTLVLGTIVWLRRSLSHILIRFCVKSDEKAPRDEHDQTCRWHKPVEWPSIETQDKRQPKDHQDGQSQDQPL